MKKSKLAPKTKQKASKPPVKSLAKVLSKVKALTKRATGMAAKTAKKPQTKAVKPVKAVAPVKAKAVKEVSAKPAKAVAPAKAAPAEKAGKKGGKPVVAAVLAKPAKPIAEAAPVTKKAKASKVPANLNTDRMCRENACENTATTKGYCRLDYIKNWKKIKRKEMILKEGKLNQYIEELVSKYPDKYIDVIRQDLSSEVNFNKVIHDLELDESIDDLEYDGDSIDALIGGIKKEDGGFDDTDF